jgi:superfamily II DNA or RNA helicase
LQQEAAEAILVHDTGVLFAATAFGKTVVAARIIAARAVNTLVLVHRRQLMDQWRERLADFLALPPSEIGQIGGGKDRRTGRIDIGILQSLNRKGSVKDFVADYGQVIVDECHHIPAVSFEQVLRAAKARYVLGLTATPIRKDGHHPIILMQCGPIRFQVSARKQAALTPFEHVVIFRSTDFRMPLTDEQEPSIHEIYAALLADRIRNEQILEDIRNVLEEGRSPLVLTERIEHVKALSTRLKEFVPNLVVLRGGMGARQREAVEEQLKAIPEGEKRVLIATGRYIGEGFDDARLDTLFLALPISWRGTVQQYAGRLHRTHENKKDVRIYDYVDIRVPVLRRMYDRRRKGYASMGYRVERGVASE